MPGRRLLFIPGVLSVANEAITRSFEAALGDRVPGTRIDASLSGPAPLGAIVALAPTGAEVAHARRRIDELIGVVPVDRIRVVLWHAGIHRSVTEADVRRLVGRLDAVWPFDPEAALAADASDSTLQALRPRSRLTRAVLETAASLAPWLAGAQPPAPLDPSAVAAAVSERLWRRVRSDPSTEGSLESDIEAELSRHLARSDGRLDADGLADVRRRLRDDILGLGPIERLLADPDVSEVMVNAGGVIFIERNGRMEPAPVRIPDEERLRVTISRIVAPAGRRVDLSSPLCDARLPDGSRANVVLPPVAVDGPLVTIRRFRPAFETLDDLVRAGTATGEQAARLRAAVAERRNVVIAGNSGAGKTTLLNALAALIPDQERIVTLEDAAELRIRKPHVVRLETRPPNAEGRGEVTMRDLVINALRMRPDRLIVGECRGTEAIPMLQAMNTGHDGSLTTLHANSAPDVVERLEAMVLLGAPQWPPDVVRRQIRSAVHLVAYLRRTGGSRRLESVGPLAVSP